MSLTLVSNCRKVVIDLSATRVCAMVSELPSMHGIVAIVQVVGVTSVVVT